MKADRVREMMNRNGRDGIPFLFGVDFEMENGFWVEHPLENPEILFKAGETGNAPTITLPRPKAELHILASNPEAYFRKFRKVRQGLLYGNSFLLNLTERTPVQTNLTLEQIFYHSRARYKLLLPGQLVCFSPESFVRTAGNRIYSYPMKGTIEAGLPDAARQLLDSYKEQCEHYTITDLIRNDLNQIATKVEVCRFRYIEKIRTLRGEILQTSSEISGQLPSDWRGHAGDLLFRLLPAGSVSGAPKPSTLRLIRETEGIPRGYYSGVFGYFNGRDLDSAVMIRYIEKEKDQYYFRSGGGITVNSKAEEEYEEMLEKIYLPI